MNPYDWGDESDREWSEEGDWRVMAALLVAFASLLALILITL